MIGLALEVWTDERNLFAARLDGWRAFQIGWDLIGREGFDIHLDKGHEWTSKVGEGASAAIHDRAGGHDDAAVIANDLNGLLDATAPGDDVFGDDEFLAGRDGEAAEDESAIAVFFDEDVAFAEMAGDFLANNDASDGGRNDGGGIRCVRRELVGQQTANLGGDGSILQEQGTLEKLAAVQAGTKNEVSVEQSTRLAE